MDTISETLKWVFTFIFYPAVVIGIFVYVVAIIVFLIGEQEGLARIRRVTAAILPLLLLIFVALSTGSSAQAVKEFFTSINPFILLAVGAVVGIGEVELGRHLIYADDEMGPSLYALFLSLVGVFMLYSLMQGILGSLHFFLFGMLLAGGLDIVFKGPPQIMTNKKGRAITQGRSANALRGEQNIPYDAYGSERVSRPVSTQSPQPSKSAEAENPYRASTTFLKPTPKP